MYNTIIAIDGPAGAGKSTISKIIADRLKIDYINTGAMYRAITLKCLRNNVDLDNNDEVIKICKNTNIDFKDSSIYLDGETVDEEIRSLEVSKNVAKISKIKEVRLHLVKIQRGIAIKGDIIMDGRDIGTFVFPDAKYKFYLIATPKERGKRRYNDLAKKGIKLDLNEIIEDIIKRDSIDTTREFAPLVKAHDAIEIDTTGKNIEEVTETVLSYIKI